MTIQTADSQVRIQNQVETWVKHIHTLADEIGPRGPTTEGERRGHRYCQGVFDKLGLEAHWETFRSARSIFTPHLIASLSILFAYFLYPRFGQVSAVSAAAIVLVAFISDLLELSFMSNPLRWIVPKGESQNVYAVQEPVGEHKQDLILIGHVDSQRTPLIFKSPRWVKVYQTFTTIAFVSFLVMAVLYIIGAITGWYWVWPASAPGALCAVLLAAICMQAEQTPFTHGANDNATAAGLILTLAERLREQPLQNTRLWLLASGCEEVQHYGAIDFLDRHRDEFLNPHVLVFEMLGCAGPAWLTSEGIVIPFKAAPKMLALAESVNDAHPDLDGYPVRISGGNTEMADALRRGIPAITLFGITRDNVAPYWHQVDDTIDKIDPQALERNYAFAWRMIHALDEESA